MTKASPAELYAYVKQNAPVIENYIETLAAFGSQPEGGIVRPVYSTQWFDAHKQLAAWMQEAGLEVRADAVGNLWGLSRGTEAGQGYASGSHLDTVKEGGKYDGALGVLAALTAIRFLKELYGAPRLPLEVVALCEEEGSRFSKSFLGSRAITGNMPVEELDQSRDADGISVAQAARNCGFDPDQLAAAQRTDLAGFIELHIEQGRLMEAAQVEIGVVEAITGIKHLRVVFEGQADHAGTTPMDLRSDALVSAAQAVTKINELAREFGRPAVATVGKLSVEPGATNIVPAQVEITVDMRHPDPATLEQLKQRIVQISEEAAAAQGGSVKIDLLMERQAAPMTPEIVNMISSSAEELGLKNMPMVSGAGHDSQVMVEKIPSGMIFVPSCGGRSHSRAEYTPIEEILPGIALLAQAFYRLAY
ncbi:MAG: allantoate amidohydrolase [Chloroflexi bacterium]|nr:allantoate amidohydrolase [Chloroflexota bacterium]